MTCTPPLPRPDPRLAPLLSGYPDDLFSDRLYQSGELAHRYGLALAHALAARLALSPHRPAGDKNLAPAFAPALDWLQAVLTAHPQTAPDDPPALRAAALALDAGNAATFDLLDAAAGAYPAVAAGELRGEQALFALDRLGLWLAYFDNANLTYAVNNRVAAEAAANHLARASPGRPLRVLELGAGAGSAALALLERLDQRGLSARLADYRMTEPNGFFRRRGERALRAARPGPALSFAALDIDRPWQQQGVAPASVDLLFAVNVLHVAADLPFTLTQARQTLAAGGALVIGECLRPFPSQPVYTELVFRLLPSYGEPGGADARRAGGFLTPEQWQEVFTAAGWRVRISPDVAAIREIYPRFFTGALTATPA